MRNIKTRLSLTALAVAASFLPALANAQDSSQDTGQPEPQLTVEERIDRLQQELETLKRQREVDQEVADKAATTAPTVVIDKKGFKATSPDKKYEFSLTGTYQLDGRQYLDDTAGLGKNEIIARRLRPTFQLKAGNATFRLTPDFAGSAVTFFDAYVDYKVSDAVNFRFGKSKTPVGFERNQSAADLVIIERNHATNLAPTRDFGVQVFGSLIPNTLEYQLGVFNGNQDLGNTNNDVDEKQDLFARLFATPFANSDLVALQGLGVGLAVSSGEREGSTTNTILGTYKTPGQLDFFKYNTGVYAFGTHKRFNPQLSYYYGPFGLLSEYISSEQTVVLGAASQTLKHEAVSVNASWVLTGENAGFKGGVKPANDFDISKGTWGAWELVATYGYTDIDDNAFGTFASLSSSASKASTYGVGVGWYLTENLKWLLNYDVTSFERGAAVGDRADEKFLATRLQVRY